MIVAPSILGANPINYDDEIKKLNQAGFKMLHLDIMDGHFVPNISFGPAIVKALRPLTSMTFDVHLMISNPLFFLDEFVKAGSDYITFHYEATAEPLELIKAIKAKGLKVGMSIKPKTNVNVLFPFLNELDLVLIMSVEPGFGGQQFMNGATEKIKALKKWKTGHNQSFLIQVDGGINNETKEIVKEAGADIIVVGSYLFRQNDFLATKNALES